MGPSKCIEQNFVNTSCKKDVVRLIDYWCGGRKSCNLRVTKIVDHLDFESCLKNIRGFLQVSYMCLPGMFRFIKILFTNMIFACQDKNNKRNVNKHIEKTLLRESVNKIYGNSYKHEKLNNI